MVFYLYFSALVFAVRHVAKTNKYVRTDQSGFSRSSRAKTSKTADCGLGLMRDIFKAEFGASADNPTLVVTDFLYVVGDFLDAFSLSRRI